MCKSLAGKLPLGILSTCKIPKPAIKSDFFKSFGYILKKVEILGMEVSFLKRSYYLTRGIFVCPLQLHKKSSKIFNMISHLQSTLIHTVSLPSKYSYHLDLNTMEYVLQKFLNELFFEV